MGVLLRGIKRELIQRGQVITAPGTMKSAKKFMAQIYVSTESSSLPALLFIASAHRS